MVPEEGDVTDFLWNWTFFGEGTCFGLSQEVMMLEKPIKFC